MRFCFLWDATAVSTALGAQPPVLPAESPVAAQTAPEPPSPLCEGDAPSKTHLPHHPALLTRRSLGRVVRVLPRVQRTCGDVTHGEQAHARVPIHCPLEGLAVGLAAVVHEPGVVPLGAGVDDAVLQGTTRASRGPCGAASAPPRLCPARIAVSHWKPWSPVAARMGDPQTSPVSLAHGGQASTTRRDRALVSERQGRERSGVTPPPRGMR